jgi:hypothetical protein
MAAQTAAVMADRKELMTAAHLVLRTAALLAAQSAVTRVFLTVSMKVG